MPFTNETVNSSNSTYTESTIVITNLLLSHGGSYSCQIESAAAVMSNSSSSTTVTVIGGKTHCMYIMQWYHYTCDDRSLSKHYLLSCDAKQSIRCVCTSNI